MQEQMWNFSGEIEISFLKLRQESLESEKVSRLRNRDVISDPRAVPSYLVPCFCAPCCTCVFMVANYGKTKINKNQNQSKPKNAHIGCRNLGHRKRGL